MDNMKNIIRKLLSHNLAKDSAIVFIGATVSNVGAYLYHLVVGRILGPVGYGELSSLISLLYIFGVPTLVLQTVLIKYFSNCKARNSSGQAKFLYKKMFKGLLIILMPLFTVLCLLSPLIADFLNISGFRVVIWVFLLFVFSTLSALSISAVQGFQLFIWVAVFAAGSALLKLVISIPFAYYGVEMTMIAALLAALGLYIVYFIPIRFLFAAKEERIHITKKDIYRYSIPTFFTLLGMTSLYSMDIVLVKHYLTSLDAGIYSSVAVLGKVIFYASSAIGTVLFPVLAERYAKGQNTNQIIKMAVILVAGVSAAVTVIYSLFPGTVIHLLFGSSYESGISYLGIFAVFITIYSIINIIVSACLATERMQIYLFTCAAALLQIAAIAVFHETILSIIYINIIITSALLVGAGGYYWYGKNKYHHSNL